MGATHALIGEQEIARGMLALAPKRAAPAASVH
jgi:CPA2 family monovalent cation:H+ antiporter-2